jgi:sugar/nucleoside kinase (ribokinase family)
MAELSQNSVVSRRGVLAAGHWIVDHICLVDKWPEQDTLSLISGETDGNGGGAYNMLKDLALLQCDFPLFAAGLVGDDADGRAIAKDCKSHRIDTTNLRTTQQAPTSYCHVITVTETGRRTFFHQKGANQFLTPAHVALSSSTARVFYLGYLGMLEEMDRLDADQRNGASRLLEQAVSLGMTTVADLCSNIREDMPAVINASLPFIDYLFLNEFEAGQLVGLDRKLASNPDSDSLIELGRTILARGVRKAVLLHVPNGVVWVQREGPVIMQGSVLVPESQIRGTAGAGDALAAGFVFGLHEGWPHEQSLRLAVSAAASSLGAPSCSASIADWKTCLASSQSLGFRNFN